MENVTYVTDTLNQKNNLVIRDKKITKDQDQKDKGKITIIGEIEINPEKKKQPLHKTSHMAMGLM